MLVTLSNGGGTITSDLDGMDAIESLILAHACAGVDVADLAYVEGIETAVEACYNRLG
jgi:homoserine dehydrogenase